MIKSKTAAGYKYLLAYKLTVPIYDYTVSFCQKYIPYNSRTNDQMVQAARSGMQNIAEGHQQNSLEELLNDYLSYARQHQMPIFPTQAVNLLITLIHQANY